MNLLIWIVESFVCRRRCFDGCRRRNGLSVFFDFLVLIARDGGDHNGGHHGRRTTALRLVDVAEAHGHHALADIALGPNQYNVEL